MSLEIIQVSPRELSDCENLKDAVHSMDNQVRKSGRVICAVLVNGKRLSEEDENRFSAMGLNEIHTLEFETDEPQSLVRSTLQAQILLMGEIERLCQSVAQDFRQLDVGRAQTSLISLLDACRWLTDALVALKTAQTWLEEMQVDSQQWQICEQQFHRVIAQILTAVETNDQVWLADLLEYELANGLVGWRQLLQVIQNK